MEGFPRLESTQDVPDLRYDRFAKLIGLKRIDVDDPERIGAAWDEALAARTPVVLSVKTDRKSLPDRLTSPSNPPGAS